MVNKWVISPTYKWDILGWNIPLILTIDPNFQRDNQAVEFLGGVERIPPRCVGMCGMCGRYKSLHTTGMKFISVADLSNNRGDEMTNIDGNQTILNTYIMYMVSLSDLVSFWVYDSMTWTHKCLFRAPLRKTGLALAPWTFDDIWYVFASQLSWGGII